MPTTLGALGSLIKPRIVALLCLTGVSSLLAAGGADPISVAAFVVAGGSIAAGAAALNCYYDRDLDRMMERTADRPLPSGELDSRIALAFALVLLVAGILVGVATLPRASVAYMGLGALSYVGLYTVVLKRRHPIGVVLGGSAGSFPVLAGWTAVRPLDAPALIMAAVVFAWTPAHAWALAYIYRDDFAAASVPTLPAVADDQRVRRSVLLSAVATAGVAALVLAFAGALYAVALIISAPLYLLTFHAYYRTGTESTAVWAFFTSNLFVAVLFAAWAADGLLGNVPAVALLAEAVIVAALYAWLWRSRPQLRDVPAAAVEWGNHPGNRPRERIERLLPIEK